MKLLSVFVVTFAALTMSSCRMAYLDKYPGVKVDSVPVEFQGVYYLKVKQYSNDPKDSISIIIRKDGWSYKEGNKGEDYILSEKTVLSKVQNYYVISSRDDIMNQYWNSWVVVNKRKKIELYPIISISNKPGDDKLSNYLKRSRIRGDEKSDSVYFYEVTDAGFVKYFEKEIRGSHTFEIIPVKSKKQ